jgi:hypothetical protein
MLNAYFSRRLRQTLVFASLLFCGGAFAAMLTFDGSICGPAGDGACSQGSIIGAGYGSVPEQLDVTYAARSAGGSGGGVLESVLRFWDVDFGDVTNVAYASGGPTQVAQIVLQPRGGFQVTLSGLDLAAWMQGWTSQLTIYDLSFNVLSSSGSLTVPATGHLHFDFAITRTDGIIIQWGPDGFDVGIDNVNFSVAALPVPEPSLFLMLACGLGAISLRLRGRSTSIAAAAVRMR